MYKIIYCSLFIVYCSLITVAAQDFDPPLRLEFDMAENKSMNMELLGKNGLVLFFQKEEKENTKWNLCHYDTNFQLLRMRSVPFETKTNVCLTASNKCFFYAVLQSDANVKTNVTNTYILQYNAETKKTDVFSFYQAEKGKILSLAHYGNVFVYSIYNSKSEERIYLFNTQTLTQTLLYEEQSCEFQDTYTDTFSRTLWLVSKWHEPKKQTSLHLTQLDSNGVVLQDFPLIPDSKYTLNSCKIIDLDDNKMLLSGNYLNNEEQRLATRNGNSGIFTTTLKNNQIESILFYEYNLLEYWTAVHKKSPANSYDISYFITQNDSCFILVSDFYSPEYQQYYSNQYAGIGFYSTPIMESKLVGYRYQTACFFTFNKEGELLWHNPFNYSDLLLKMVRPLFCGYIDNETSDVLCLFGYNNKIFSLIYNKTEIVQGIKAINISSSSRFENINSAEKSLCQSWYGSNFIHSAYQRTSKKYGSNSRKNSKYVFGVNRLGYR